jgi:hypothetical protein
MSPITGQFLTGQDFARELIRLETLLPAEVKFGTSIEVAFTPTLKDHDSDEVRVYDLLADRADRREALLTLLVGTYFERRRLMLTELLVPAATPDEAIERRTRIDELTAVIDALTGGLLSRNLKRRSAVAAEGR